MTQELFELACDLTDQLEKLLAFHKRETSFYAYRDDRFLMMSQTDEKIRNARSKLNEKQQN